MFVFSMCIIIHYVANIAGHGAEEVKMVDFVDDINAYTYSYPLELPSRKRSFKW